MNLQLRRSALWRVVAWAVVSLAASSSGVNADATEEEKTAVKEVARTRAGLEALVPDIATEPYRLEPGTRPYLHRFSLTPGYGSLGSEALFTLRLAYNPNSWLGYEGSLGHNPGQSVHAVLHSVSALVRYPLPGRFQPYVSLGYGMMMVSPGRSR